MLSLQIWRAYLLIDIRAAENTNKRLQNYAKISKFKIVNNDYEASLCEILLIYFISFSFFDNLSINYQWWKV